MSVEIKGLDKLVVKLDKIANLDISNALEKACLVVENAAKEKCPVDTGRLRNSISHEVENDEGIIGTNVEYAPYVEFGTYKMKAQPFLQPALNENKDKINKILNSGVQEAIK